MSKKRNQAAKNSINSTWKNFLCKQNVSVTAKWKLFLAVCRAIQTYGSQVWGFSNFEEVDKLCLYFLKKILKLPTFTPTYILMLETGVENGHVYTLGTHLKYLHRAMFEYNEERLPHKLAKLIHRRQLFWAKKINELMLENNMERLDYNSSHTWIQNSERLLKNLRSKYIDGYRAKANETRRFYGKLDASVGQL